MIKKWNEYIAYIVLIVSAINWGIMGLFDFNIIEKVGMIFFPVYSITFAYYKTIIYIFIGIMGIYAGYIEIKQILKNGK